jgi:hypothetical protein
MGNNLVDIKFVQHWVRVLEKMIELIARFLLPTRLTLLRLAVNTTTSYISPIFFKKLSTPGRLMTYTLCQ